MLISIIIVSISAFIGIIGVFYPDEFGVLIEKEYVLGFESGFQKHPDRP